MLASKTRNRSRRDVGDMLLAQLSGHFGKKASIALKNERPWASITFSGTRYRFEVKLPDGASEAKLQGLDDHEFDLPGWFVADVLIHEGRQDAARVIEILTIADPVSERNGPAIEEN